MINLCLPQAFLPLAHQLDVNMKPTNCPDGKLDKATEFLRGEWLAEDQTVSKILERDQKQVYNTSIQKVLETCNINQNAWRDWMNPLVVGEAGSKARAKFQTEDKVA